MHASNGETVTLLKAKPGDQRKLPAASIKGFSAGLGWDQAQVGGDADGDLWILRHRPNGVEVIAWPNVDWHRPDLGTNSQGQPFIAPPELDVIHQGDDRTGAESAGGYDENAKFDLNKSPADTIKYSVWATIYDEKNAGLTLGMLTNVKFGIVDEASSNGYETDPAATQPFDISMHLADIVRNADGSWSLIVIEEDKRGRTTSMIDVCTNEFGIVFNS